jgi:hypothetical protein
MGNIKRDVAEMESQTTAVRPRLVVALGRGRTGKSTFLRYVAETSSRTRPLRILDADPNNQTLCKHFPDAERPDIVDGAERHGWVESQIERMVLAAAGEGDVHDALLDLGGGDRLMKRLGKEVGLVPALEEAGVDVTAVHMIGPHDADLTFLDEVETSGLFSPRRVLVILNGGLAGDRSVAKAFGSVTTSPVLEKIGSAARGGRIMVMPPLACMSVLEEKDAPSFAWCLTDEGRRAVGIFNAQRVRTWLDGMSQLRAECGNWLP